MRIRLRLTKMTTDTPTPPSQRHFWRLAFLLLVVAPFLPEIVIYLTAALAKIMGCQLDQKNACLIGPIPVSDIIAFALQVGAGLIVAARNNGILWLVVFFIVSTAWLVVCFVALTFGWAHARSRLLLGFAVALVFAVLPFFGPLLAIGNLVYQNCQPNEGGVGSCVMFGGYVGPPAHDAVKAGWLILAGAPIALGAFVIYAIVTIIIHAFSAKRAGTEVR